ncbi:MAG: hypothetical protein HZA54_07945 [Planctomycetes bacterium]|nr:hypothetical protein [Planctomycetota bacterium]
MFTDAFGFRESRRLCFAPNDRVANVYRAMYPPYALSDCMDLETLLMSVEDRYGVDLGPNPWEEVTLGELFAHTGARAA